MEEVGSLEFVREETDFGAVNIAVQGCCHGELDTIYSKIRQVEDSSGTKVDLLLICGDFECVRDTVDLCCMAVPPKYRHLKTFYKYFNGEVIAPVKTIFIGGNHEASNVLQSLYYGGYVAPNIYFLGWAAVVNFKGLRIGGLSGIYNEKHYTHGHFERPPYTENTIRTIYHIRAYEIQQMLRLPSPATSEGKVSDRNVDIFLTHDWPTGVWDYGDVDTLLRIKPHFRGDIEKGVLGSPPARKILDHLQPHLWFSGHMHIKFPAVVPHPTAESTSTSPRVTRFLALDKVIPGRGYLQFLQVPVTPPERLATSDVISIPIYQDDELHFDVEWCTIVRLTHAEMRQTRYLYRQMPDVVSFDAMAETMQLLRQEYGPDLIIPMQPLRGSGPTTSTVCQPPLLSSTSSAHDSLHMNTQRSQEGNPQTDRFLRCFGLNHIWTIPYGLVGATAATTAPTPPQRSFTQPPNVSHYGPSDSRSHPANSQVTPSISRPLIPSQVSLHRPSATPDGSAVIPPSTSLPQQPPPTTITTEASDPNEIDI